MPDPASLQNLKDIVEPAAVGFWPPAPGVWLLLALALLWSGFGVALGWLRWRQDAYRRAGVRELLTIRGRLEAEGPKEAIHELAVLLKRVALTAFPRDRVASISGDNWLAFLDATMRGGTFAGASGKLLTDSLYRSTGVSFEISHQQVEELFERAGTWIKRHRSTLPVEMQDKWEGTRG